MALLSNSPFSENQSGFTLIELMVVVAIVGVLLLVAFPEFDRLIQGQRLKTQANETLSAIVFAKSEALKRRSSVTVCAMKTAINNQCGTTGNEWANGWVIFVDSNNDGVVSNGEEVIKSRGNYEKLTSTASVTGFIFDFEGVANTSGDINFCYGKANGNKRRRLSLTPGGLPIISAHEEC